MLRRPKVTPKRKVPLKKTGRPKTEIPAREKVWLAKDQLNAWAFAARLPSGWVACESVRTARDTVVVFAFDMKSGDFGILRVMIGTTRIGKKGRMIRFSRRYEDETTAALLRFANGDYKYPEAIRETPIKGAWHGGKVKGVYTLPPGLPRQNYQDDT
jgi:hypothetical protein